MFTASQISSYSLLVICRVYNKTEKDFNKNIWIPAFAGMTEVERWFCYKPLVDLVIYLSRI